MCESINRGRRFVLRLAAVGCALGTWTAAPTAHAITVISTGPGTSVTLGIPYGTLEMDNPLDGDETILDCRVLEWRDAGWPGYEDWEVNDSANIDGYSSEIWLRAAGDTAFTTTTVPSVAVSVHLHGDGNDGLAEIIVDGVSRAELDMHTSGTDDAFVLVTGLPFGVHDILVVDNGVGSGGPSDNDIALMGAAACAGLPDCDSTSAPGCLQVCPLGDILYVVTVHDSVGNPTCDLLGTWLDFGVCPTVIPCPAEEPDWPLVRPDSCDPATGEHFFSVNAGITACVECEAELWVDGAPCKTVTARFFDNDGDLCVTPGDFSFTPPCQDFNCDGTTDVLDGITLASHGDHCCPGGFCDSVVTDTCLLICPVSDVVHVVTVEDFAGNPVCDSANIWIDMSGCLPDAVPCPGEEPNWPLVYSDSCDPATGEHFFTVDASLTDCIDCSVELWVRGVLCRTLTARFFDVTGDFRVSSADFNPFIGIIGICNDYNCDGTADIADFIEFVPHLEHCCPVPGNCCCPYQGDVAPHLATDRIIDVLDVVFMIDYVFRSSGIPPPQDVNCPASRGDWNCGQVDAPPEVIDVLDVVASIDHVFRSGPPPCAPCECAPYPTGCPVWP